MKRTQWIVWACALALSLVMVLGAGDPRTVRAQQAPEQPESAPEQQAPEQSPDPPPAAGEPTQQPESQAEQQTPETEPNFVF